MGDQLPLRRGKRGGTERKKRKEDEKFIANKSAREETVILCPFFRRNGDFVTILRQIYHIFMPTVYTKKHVFLV
jgi:hypothetical protein